MPELKPQMIAVKSLVIDPTNTRRAASPDADKEMAESVKAQGILASLLVRPKGAKFEVVCGHRRLAGAIAAGLDQVPCQVQELTDEQAKEKQLTENLQREDLDPIDEAQALATLMAKGKTVDQLHAQLGKPKAYIFRRARLAKLDKKWLKMVKDGELGLEHLEIVVQLIDDVEEQNRYIDELRWEMQPTDDPEETREHIIRKHMRKLKGAPWDLKKDGIAGCIACAVCPQRSNSQQDLLGGAGKEDSCLDGKCWSKKLKAHGEEVLAAARADGKEVYTGDKADKAIKDAKSSGSSTLVALDSSPSWWGESGDLRQALKGKKVAVAVYAQGKNGQLQELVTRKEFYAALPKRANVETSSGTGGPARAGKLSPAEKAQRRTRLLDLKAKAVAWPKAWDQVITKLAAKGANLAMFKFFAFVMIKHHGDHHLVNEPGHRMNVKSGTYDYKNAVANHLMKATSEKEVLSIIWNAALGSGLWDTGLTNAAKDLFQHVGVDWNAMKAAEAKQIKEAREAKIKAKLAGIKSVKGPVAAKVGTTNDAIARAKAARSKSDYTNVVAKPSDVKAKPKKKKKGGK